MIEAEGTLLALSLIALLCALAAQWATKPQACPMPACHAEPLLAALHVEIARLKDLRALPVKVASEPKPKNAGRRK